MGSSLCWQVLVLCTVLNVRPLFHSQGIDLKAGGRNKKVHRTAPKSGNVYVKLLVKVRSEESVQPPVPRTSAQASAAAAASAV